jgi:hypothetical protein
MIEIQSTERIHIRSDLSVFQEDLIDGDDGDILLTFPSLLKKSVILNLTSEIINRAMEVADIQKIDLRIRKIFPDPADELFAVFQCLLRRSLIMKVVETEIDDDLLRVMAGDESRDQREPVTEGGTADTDIDGLSSPHIGSIEIRDSRSALIIPELHPRVSAEKDIGIPDAGVFAL